MGMANDRSLLEWMGWGRQPEIGLYSFKVHGESVEEFLDLSFIHASGNSQLRRGKRVSIAECIEEPADCDSFHLTL
jgi:hypothetical protein